MSRRPILQTLAMSLSVPRGNDAFWQIIRELNRTGHWTIRMVANRTNADLRTVSRFVEPLRKGGYVEEVGELPRVMNNAKVYRLAKSPIETPRLRADGTALPETANETMWRAMKMLKDFGAKDVAEACPTVALSTIRGYMVNLAAAGVIVKVRQRGPASESRFRLRRNLGSKAPRVLVTKIVFDPNSNTIVGSSLAREVQP